jgi:type I restriction enzyme M protein
MTDTYSHQSTTDTKAKASKLFNIFKDVKNQDFILFLLGLDKKGAFKIPDGYSITEYLDNKLTFNQWVSSRQLEIDKQLVDTFEDNEEVRDALTTYALCKQLYQIGKESRSKFLETREDERIKSLFLDFPNYQKDEIPEIFEHYLNLIARYEGRKSGKCFQPDELTKFICSLVNLPENASVYNPFAGYASFGFGLRKFKKYIAQDNDDHAIRIGLLRLMVHDLDGISQYFKGDSIRNYNPTNERFDLIVAFPSLHLKADDSTLMEEINPEDANYDDGFLIDVLSKEGKRVYILPQDFFYDLCEENFNYFFDPNSGTEAQMIISLPAGILRDSQIPLTVIFLSDARRRDIQFVDGSDCFIKAGRKLILDHEKLLSRIEINDHSFVKIVPLEDIFVANNNLNPKRYLIENIEGIPLGYFASIASRDLLEEEKGKEFAIIQYEDLKNDPIDFNIHLEDFELEDFEFGPNLNSKIYKILEGPVLLLSHWGNLSPTYCNNEAEFCIKFGVNALKLDLAKVDIGYLVGELHKEYVIDQFKAFQIQGRIKQDDLLKIKVHLPELEEQAKINEKPRTLYFKRKKIEFEEKYKEAKINELLNFESVRHAIRQYLNNLKSNISGTEKFIRNNERNQIALQTIYSKNLNITLEDHFINAMHTIDSIDKLLSTIEESDSLERINRSPQRNNLIDLINQCMKRFEEKEIFKFEIYFDRSAFEIEGKSIKPIVAIHKEDFFRMFNNIVANAKDHGFKDSHNKANIIRTSLTFNTEINVCEMEVSNNGKPFHRGYTEKNLITKGDKTADSGGTGMGGYDIKVIVEKYGGKLKVLNEPENEFPVVYIISLPINKSENYEN